MTVLEFRPPGPRYSVDIPDMVDCRETATVSIGDAFACESHRTELVLASAAEEIDALLLHLAGTGHVCGEHLRGEVTS